MITFRKKIWPEQNSLLCVFTTLLVALIHVHFLNRNNRSKYIIFIGLSGPDIEDFISSVTLSIIIFSKMAFFAPSHLEWTIFMFQLAIWLSPPPFLQNIGQNF